MDKALIERLARLRGIGEAYHNYRGELKHFSLETKAGILAAMGCAPQDDGALAHDIAQAEAARCRKFLPAVAAARGPRVGFDINVTAREFGSTIVWRLRFENGALLDGTTSTADCAEVWRREVAGSWITRRRFELAVDLPPGYHEFEAKTAGGDADHCRLIVSPPKCFEPEAIAAGRRLWGIALQLYTVRSHSNWGIGDFGDLETLIRWVASCGAGFIGLNPLHALAPADAARASPYSASSRHFLNVLYIAVPAVPEFEQCEAARARLEDPETLDRLNVLRAQAHVDYAGVANLKLEILALLYQEFRDKHLAARSARAASYLDFVAGRGAPLQLHARFDALDRYFRATSSCASGWMNWPYEYRDVNGSAAARFALEHAVEVEFYAYLQWLAHEQLLHAQALTRELGMPIGLYGDYAVGANPSGSETWVDKTGYALGAEIGAPPDPLALKGQGWGIPPPDPGVMQSQRLQGFVDLIRNNMRYYGALRLDHVMSLFRLWWVPDGCAATDGAYVHYPLQALLTVLALESKRNSCMVVGEDLGVVPDEMRRAMPEFGLYHYKVLLFEKIAERFRRPEEFVRHALATATTHDMPTLCSYWEARDIELRRRLRLYPTAQIENDIVRERDHDREQLLAALREQGLDPGRPSAPLEPYTAALGRALHVYLARSSTALVAVQIEDLLGMIDPVNVPGTHHEYPNWQRKLSADLEDVMARKDFSEQFAQINRARGGG
ncbi:MAG TPA: 4-alpha-glucanotransferase [Steroidobacteraceae bacterium]|nr:4-alpha-glucanotransferase [Steroidobacteraceae bacterium]